LRRSNYFVSVGTAAVAVAVDTLAFVSDYSSGKVTLVNYSTSANVKRLGKKYGIAKPLTVVDWPNAVY